ncbi:hypothetical protein F511_20584 [Dorcoceras hygrometricum]|uniref:Uncharacterized protein n=1 Tax=Dorcoceras hygrometricum TaxID=472368 RepID=A0A2Z7DGK9_9LAMI|nr:hypothetical protein F511_20584 [Dorcoceras hygrometricum]
MGWFVVEVEAGRVSRGPRRGAAGARRSLGEKPPWCVAWGGCAACSVFRVPLHGPDGSAGPGGSVGPGRLGESRVEMF